MIPLDRLSYRIDLWEQTETMLKTYIYKPHIGIRIYYLIGCLDIFYVNLNVLIFSTPALLQTAKLIYWRIMFKNASLSLLNSI